MKKHVVSFAAAIACLAVPEAQAQRMQDLSMSPSEMIQQQQQQAVHNNNAPQNNSLTANPYTAPQYNNMTAPQPAQNFQASSNYMDGYCDPNFRTMLSGSPRYAGMEACLQQQRQDACARYKAVAPDVKAALDSSINCIYLSSNGDGGDEEDGEWHTGSRSPRSCGDASMARLDLLKKYWTDENASYALVFLPDDVMDTSGKCLSRR